MLAQQRTADIGTCIVDPEEDEHAEWQHGVVDHFVLWCQMEGERIEQREGQGDVEL